MKKVNVFRRIWKENSADNHSAGKETISHGVAKMLMAGRELNLVFVLVQERHSENVRENAY